MNRTVLATVVCVVLNVTASRAADPVVVWTDTPWQALKPDLKPPANPSQSIKLAAARGGIASGLCPAAVAFRQVRLGQERRERLRFLNRSPARMMR
ncbi:MAG: hypothetical protein ABR915_10105 [Thermoguttaceae bacterium]|jgi:hypothetical protein